MQVVRQRPRGGVAGLDRSDPRREDEGQQGIAPWAPPAEWPSARGTPCRSRRPDSCERRRTPASSRRPSGPPWARPRAGQPHRHRAWRS
eukprot:6970245-Alexandrium_andersonii.AAC.1